MTLVQGGTLRSQRDIWNLHHKKILSILSMSILLRLLTKEVNQFKP